MQNLILGGIVAAFATFAVALLSVQVYCARGRK